MSIVNERSPHVEGGTKTVAMLSYSDQGFFSCRERTEVTTLEAIASSVRTSRHWHQKRVDDRRRVRVHHIRDSRTTGKALHAAIILR